MTGKKLSWIDKLVRILNWAAALGMVLAVLGYYVDPRTTSLLALLGLGYPILLVVNLLFVIYWGFKARRQLWISVLALLISWGQFTTFYRLRFKKTEAEGQEVKVMSFNVRMFNRYRWIDQPGVAEEIRKTIENQAPDLLFIQEYYTYDETPKFNFPHSYIQVTNQGKNYGLAIFSQYPIIRTGRVPYHSPGESQNDEFIYADLLIGGDTIRAINTHLASLKLDYRDYTLLEHPNQEEQEEVKKGLFTILGRIQAAFKRQAHQVDALLDFLAKNRLPVILAGDLNDTPSSRAYRRITHVLTDAYTLAGAGFSGTYVRSPIPLRIDHLFFSAGITPTNHKVVRDGPWSDHYPIVVSCTFD